MDIDLRTLTDKQIEDQIIEGADLNGLYRIDVMLERRKTSLFVDLAKEKEMDLRTRMKATLSWTENMHEICKKRQDDVKASNDRYNWYFRIEAQKILPPEKYAEIAEKVKMSYGRG